MEHYPDRLGPSLRGRLVPGDGSPVYELRGELDMGCEQALPARISELGHEGQTVVIDLSRVSGTDSRGLRVLVRILQLRPSITMRNPAEAVRRILDLTGLSAHLHVETTDES